MPGRNPLPESLEENSFSVHDALELGVPAKRLRAGDLESPFRSVRAHEIDWDDIESICAAYATVMPSDSVFSHVTAARIYGIPLPMRLETRRSIDVITHEIQIRAEGVIGHRSRPLPTRWTRGIPVVEPARAFVQLGAILGAERLVVTGDFLIQRENPLCTVDELQAASADARGVRGIRKVRMAITRIRPGTDSPMETLLRLVITRAGLPEPVIGHKIYGAHGEYIGRPDLSYVAEKIAIEYEGEQHQTDPVRFARDIERRERMQEAGWYVIRVISEHLYERRAWLVARVTRVLRDRQFPSNVQ
jgi:hypothetical protein